MLKLIIEGKSLTEIHSTIHNMSRELDEAQVSTTVVEREEAFQAASQSYAGSAGVETHAATEPTAPVSNTGLTLDKDGIPWDQRIHSNGQIFDTKGYWRRRRNLDDAVYNEVYAELKAKYGNTVAAAPVHVVPAMPTTAVAAQMPQAPGSVDQALAMTVPQAAVQIAPPPAPIQAPVNPLTQAHTVESFKQNLVAIISQLVTDKKIDQAWIANCSRDFFGGKEVFDWAAHQGAGQLFQTFATWGFVQKIQV